jgi:tetratricopeptide (TPR) repeat protein
MHTCSKLILSVLLVLGTTIQAFAVKDAATVSVNGTAAVEATLEKAAQLYAERNYTASADLYEILLKQNGKSSEVYYNLGNAYFKADKIAKAILNYERALRLSPGDADARFNLQLCQTRIVDQITPVGKFLLVRWYESLSQLMGSNGWSWTSILFFFVFVCSLSAYFLARRRWLKKTGFFVGILGLLLAILAFVYAYQAKQKLEKSDEAIVFALSVTAKSSPDQSGNDLFVLHEGVKVVLKSRLGDWCEIELSDGNVGWLPASEIEII